MGREQGVKIHRPGADLYEVIVGRQEFLVRGGKLFEQIDKLFHTGSDKREIIDGREFTFFPHVFARVFLFWLVGIEIR